MPELQPEPEPEPEPEQELEPEPEKPGWVEVYSAQHQQWYWMHAGTGQASWLKEAAVCFYAF